MENKTIINWYDLRDNQYIYLNGGILDNLLDKGIKVVDSKSNLQKALNSSIPYNKNKTKGISVKNLKKLLNYINIKYDYINDKILEIRKHKNSIKNQKFPINLHNKKIGRILGNIVSDGCLYYDKCRKNFIRTKYCSEDKELIDIFTDSINKIFGEVYFNKEFIRNCSMIRYGNSFIGECLKKVGAPIGKKYELNSGIPWLIKEGDINIKRNYLSAIFDDEGSLGKTDFSYLILSRNIHINFDNKDKNKIKKFIIPLMKSSSFPTGHITKRISIGKIRKILEKNKEYSLLNKILNYKPKIIVDESKLLKNDFNINNHLYVMSLHLTPNRNFSVQTSMVIRTNKEVEKFYNQIGFNLKRKQDKLKQILTNKGG